MSTGNKTEKNKRAGRDRFLKPTYIYTTTTTALFGPLSLGSDKTQKDSVNDVSAKTQNIPQPIDLD